MRLGPKNRTRASTAEIARFDAAIADDLNMPRALIHLDAIVALKHATPGARRAAIGRIDEVTGARPARPDAGGAAHPSKGATLAAEEIEARLDARLAARAAKNFARSDAIRDELNAAGVDVMDGDPLRWEWRIALDD